jgi:ABC-type uncharacterized transport system auxiliary subunit
MLFPIGLALLIPAGCGISRPYPVIRSFTIEVNAPQAVQTAASSKRLLMQVVPTGSVSSCETRKLIRKVGPNELAEDFYNEFTGLPARMVADETARFLDSSSIVQAERAVSLKGTDLVLELYLQAFYGDYTSEPPQAVIEVRYTLTDVRRGERILLSKSYRGQSPIALKGDKAYQADQKNDSAAQLVSSLGAALENILTELQSNLQKALNAGR